LYCIVLYIVLSRIISSITEMYWLDICVTVVLNNVFTNISGVVLLVRRSNL